MSATQIDLPYGQSVGIQDSATEPGVWMFLRGRGGEMIGSVYVPPEQMTTLRDGLSERL